MKFAIDAWAPEYGAGAEPDALTPSDVPTDITVEVAVDRWAPLDPRSGPAPHALLFVDGVRRVEARVWISGADGVVRGGICASYAAGVVRCNERAVVEAATVERRLFSAAPGAVDIETRHGVFCCTPVSGDTPEGLSLGLQQKMGELEVRLARDVVAGTDEVVVVDGPLRQHGHVAGTVGSIKSQHRSYGPPVVLATVGALAPGQRTPVFHVGDRFGRFSWYVRLPGPVDHPLAGVVRCEASSDVPVADVVRLADRIAAALPRFASQPHKDTRAPQNLYPIAGLERELRRRLGDPALLYRSLREAAAV
jgi:hypothetical protein